MAIPPRTEMPEIPGGWTERTIALGKRSWKLVVPAQPDAFLESPERLAAYERDGTTPYWAYLWPVSLAMAEAVVSARWPTDARLLEIGAGVGLVGLAAAQSGVDVTLSDYEQTAVDVALYNARRNGFKCVRGRRIDWRDPIQERFDVVLGCDVLYDPADHEAILNFVAGCLTPKGVCWLGDPARATANDFATTARHRGWKIDAQPLTGRNSDDGSRLFILRRT